MLGIVMLLCTSCTSVFQLSIQFCISLAVGTLTGDALLHLLPMVSDYSTNKSRVEYSLKFLALVRGREPDYWSDHVDFPAAHTHFDSCVQFLGLHVHSDAQRHSHGGHEEETPDYIYKMLVVIGGIYFFYLMETMFSLIAYKDNHHHHQHHHAVRGYKIQMNTDETDKIIITDTREAYTAFLIFH